MNKLSYLTITLTVLALSKAVLAHQVPVNKQAKLIPIPAYSQVYGEASAAAALKAIRPLINSFEPIARKKFMFELNATQRSKWSNLPAGIIKRTGISIGEMSDEQRTNLFNFLSASLSPEGYNNLGKIMAAEAFLSTDKRAKRLKWAPENYWFSLYGEPSLDQPWGWQFGGHHLAINISIENQKVVTMSPSFLGTEPAVFSYEGVDYQVIVDMHTSAFKVFESLDTHEQQQARQISIPKDIYTGAGNDGVVTKLKGISGANMSPQQKSLLLQAIAKWVTIQPSEKSEPRMKEIESQLDQTRFAFKGSDDVNEPSYMRIQGPSLIIELLSTGGNVGQSAKGLGHYHTIYRNLGLDYGAVKID